jgi:hypothetical protein
MTFPPITVEAARVLVFLHNSMSTRMLEKVDEVKDAADTPGVNIGAESLARTATLLGYATAVNEMLEMCKAMLECQVNSQSIH